MVASPSAKGFQRSRIVGQTTAGEHRLEAGVVQHGFVEIENDRVGFFGARSRFMRRLQPPGGEVVGMIAAGPILGGRLHVEAGVQTPVQGRFVAANGARACGAAGGWAMSGKAVARISPARRPADADKAWQAHECVLVMGVSNFL